MSARQMAKKAAVYQAMRARGRPDYFAFNDWRPDIAGFPAPAKSLFLSDAKNVVPVEDGYEPVGALTSATDALGVQPKGAASFIDKSGNTFHVVGDATGLNKLLDDGTWEDVTRMSGAYSVATAERWTFGQFGDQIVATQIGNTPQAMNMTSETDFSDLGGTPPRARFGASFRSQYLLMNLSTGEADVIACAINNLDSWPGDGTGSSWSYTCTEGGPLRGGYQAGGVFWMFQQAAIRRVTFVPDEFVVDIDLLYQNHGVDVMHALAVWGEMAFYPASDGLYQFSPGTGPVPIGRGKFDRWFVDDYDSSQPHLVSSTIDPRKKIYALAYPGPDAVSEVPNRILLYHWPTGKAAYLGIELETLFVAHTLGFTLDEVSDLFADMDSVTPPLDSPYWAGGTLLMGAMGTDQKFATFQGDNLEATFESGDAQIAPRRAAIISTVEPDADVATASDVSVAIGKKTRQGATASFASAQSCNSQGEVHPNRHGRFQRVRTIIASGAEWSRARGAWVTWREAGAR